MSVPIRQLIQKEMDRMGLIPGQYAAAHLRALYGRITSRENSQTIEWTRNAINCASSLFPGKPIYFASDHTYAIQAALEYGTEMSLKSSSSSKIKIVARQQNPTNDLPPLHLDNAQNITIRQPEEFYDTWVDLYLMGMSRCVTVGWLLLFCVIVLASFCSYCFVAYISYILSCWSPKYPFCKCSIIVVVLVSNQYKEIET